MYASHQTGFVVLRYRTSLKRARSLQDAAHFFSLNCVVRLCRAAEAWTAALRYDGCIEAMAGETGTDGTGAGLRAISFMA